MFWDDKNALVRDKFIRRGKNDSVDLDRKGD